MTNGARTIKQLQAEGYVAESVERWNAFSQTRKDLFGFVDVIAVRQCKEYQSPVRFIQCTSRANMSARVKKIRESPAYCPVRSSGRIEVWGWYKEKNRWQVKITTL